MGNLFTWPPSSQKVAVPIMAVFLCNRGTVAEVKQQVTATGRYAGPTVCGYWSGED
jgi:hypothetical protein